MKKSVHLMSITIMLLIISLGCAIVSTPVPPTITPTLIPTSTHVLPTSTNTPEPTPTIDPPSVSFGFLTGVQVLNLDNFDNSNNWDKWNSGTGSVLDGMFMLTGQQGYMSGLVYKQKIQEGNGIVLKYKAVKNSDFLSEFVFATGEYGADTFRQFGIYNGKRPKADLYQGTQGLGFNNLHGNLLLKADTWYNLLMVVGKNGELLAVIWNPEDPSQQLVYHERIGDKWAGLKWEFQAKADIGETVYIDDFLLLSFGGFK